jgi:hypothetical protein
MNTMTEGLRDLLYAPFLMRDGRFHLLLHWFSKPLDQDSSLYGDVGFWAKTKVYEAISKRQPNQELR